MATADLWVFNAEIVGVSFFSQVTSIFHLRGGENQKKIGAYLLSIPRAKLTSKVQKFQIAWEIWHLFRWDNNKMDFGMC